MNDVYSFRCFQMHIILFSLGKWQSMYIMFCNLLFLECFHMINVHFYFYASGFIVFYFMATLYVLDISQSYIYSRIAYSYISLVLSSYTVLWISLPDASTYHLPVVPFISAQCPDQWLSHPSHLGQIVSEGK